MKNVFLGPFLHWLVILALIGLGWFGGLNRFHASTFNPFIILLIAVVIVAVVVVVWTSPKGQQVTRDPIVEPEDKTD